MPGAADWQNIPTDVLDATDMQQKADAWAKDQWVNLAQDWGDSHQTTPQPTPPPSDDLTNPLGTRYQQPSAPPEPVAGAAPPPPPMEPAAVSSTAAPAPAASTLAETPPEQLLSQGVPSERQSQFGLGLSSADAMAFCGPTAAIAFAKTYGRNPSVAEAKQLAQSVGWNPGQGMAGVASEQALLTKLGVQTKLEQGINWDHVAQDANGGNPVIIDTPGHYFYVTGARDGPNGKEFNVGTSGTDLRAGAQWMTAAQMAKTMGAPRAALYADHPLAAGPSQAEQTPLAQIGEGAGKAWQAVTEKASDVAQAVQDLGGKAASDIGGAVGMVTTGQGLEATNKSAAEAAAPIASLGTGGTAESREQAFYAMMRGEQPLTGQAAVGGVQVGLPMVAQLVGPGGDVQAVKAGAGDLKDTLRNALLNPRRAMSPEEAQLAAPEVTRLEPEIQGELAAGQAAAKPTEQDLMAQWQQQLENLRNQRGFKEAKPAEQQQMVADAQADFAREQAGGAGGAAAPPAPPAPPGPPGPTPPPEMGGAGGVGAMKSPQVMEALREYAAAVGPQSNAAKVAAQQSARGAGEFGSQVDIGRIIANNKDQARQVLDQKLGALGVQDDPDVLKFIKNVETPSAVPDMPILGGLQKAQNEIKGVIFPLSMFHAYTEGLYSMFSRAGGARDFAAAFASAGPTQAAQQLQMWLRAAKAGVTHLYDTQAFDAPGVASGLKGAAIRAGIGGVGGAGAGYAETKITGGTDEQAQVNALIGGLAGGVGAVAAKPLISDRLWRAVQFSKVKTFESLVNSGVEDQVAAAAVNRTFGGLNYAQMGRNQTFQDLLRLTVQAPDWQESTARQLGAAFFGRDAGASFSRGLLARTVTGSALATEILNMAFTGHPTWENEPGHEFQVQLPSGTADKPVYIGIGPGNLQQYADLAAKVAKEPDKALARTYRGQREIGDIPQALVNRAAALPRMIGEGLGVIPAFGGTKAPLPAEVASQAAPISVSTDVQARMNQMNPLVEAALLATGMNPRYGSAQAPARQPIRSQPSQKPQKPQR